MLANDDDLPQRIVEKIEGEALDDCWEWTAASHPDGYGQVWHDDVWRTAHRAVYELLVGPVPDGLELDHLCRNRACVNPRHLEPVTHAENMRRSRSTHCRRGHELTDDNVYVRPSDNQRHCRTCRAIHRRAAWPL